MRAVSTTDNGIEKCDMESKTSELDDIEKQASAVSQKGTVVLDESEDPLQWKNAKKWKNVLAVATMTLLTPFASSMFAPAIDQVMETMNTTNRDIGAFAVSIYLLGYAFGPLIIAPCSELCGRLPIYHMCTFFFILTNIACALSVNMPMLIVFRFLTGMIGAGPLTVGPGTVSDCFGQEERGRAMAVWTMPVLLGPCIGPAIGAYISRFLGWRWTFWFLIIVTGAVFIIGLIVQDETHAPTLLRKKIQKSAAVHCEMPAMKQGYTRVSGRVFWTNISRPTKMLFLSPIVFGLSLLTAFAYGTLYLLFTTVTEVFRTRYGIVANVGLVYLGFGIGQFAGLFLFGAFSDRIMISMTRKNGGESKPEYRLPPMLPGGAMVPLGLLLYGWTAQYNVFWLVPLVGTFLIGFGMITIFSPVTTYLVDSFPVYAASATAANTVFRSVGGALLPLAGDRMYAALDQGWGNTLLAAISLVCMAMILLVLKYGEALRTNPRFKLDL